MRSYRPQRFFLTTLAILVAWFPSVAWAQSTIGGLVTDTTGGALPGVTVEAASPALIEKVRTVVTDGQGRYSIVDLRPGAYAVTFTLPGFRPLRREGIEVAANVNVPVNIQLQVGALEETVTVSGATPVVEVHEAARRQVLGRDTIDTLPTSRTMGSLGAITPGVKLSQPDMGGITGFSQAYLQGRGRGASENMRQVEGIDAQPIQLGGSDLYTNYGMVEEVSYQTSGGSAESGSGGVRINMIPREGGNSFKGDLYAGGTRGAWQSNNLRPEFLARGVRTPDATEKMLEITPAFGGPILRDKLWFFGSYRYNHYTRAPGGARYTDGRQGFDYPTVDSGSGRLTWQATRRNKITAFYDRVWRERTHVEASTEVPPSGIDWGRATYYWAPTSLYYYAVAKWTSTLTNRWLLETGFAPTQFTNSHTLYHGMKASDPESTVVLKPYGSPEWYAGAARLDPVRGTLTSAPGSTNGANWHDPTYAISSALSFVTGSHNLKMGVQWKFGASETSFGRGNADLIQRYRNGVPDAVDIGQDPTVLKEVWDGDVGVFAQEMWTINRLTVSPGIRVEHTAAHIGETSMPGNRFLPARTVPESWPIPSWNGIAPRISLTYDLFGNAKTALKFSAGKYHKKMETLGMVRVYNLAGGTDRRNWFDCDLIPGTSTCSGAALPTNSDDIAQENEIGPSSNLKFGLAPSRRADPNLKREYNWDYTVSVQHELLPRVSVNAAWYYSKFYNLWSTRMCC